MDLKKTLKKKKNILNLIIAILSLCALGLVAGLTCFECSDTYHENQFIDATIFGYFVISLILVISIFCEEEIPTTPMLSLCLVGAMMYLVTFILLFLFLNKNYFSPKGKLDRAKGRAMVAMIVCLFAGILYLFEFVVGIIKSDILK